MQSLTYPAAVFYQYGTNQTDRGGRLVAFSAPAGEITSAMATQIALGGSASALSFGS